MSTLIYYSEYVSPIGRIILSSTSTHLTGLCFEDPTVPSVTTPNGSELSIMKQTKQWLDAYFSGQAPDISFLPLSFEGTPFQKTVWELLTHIPYGTLSTYGILARETARRLNKNAMSAQAIGGAVGRNPISIIIPCHRIIGSNRTLIGYTGGLSRKQWLLENEKANLLNPFYLFS